MLPRFFRSWRGFRLAAAAMLVLGLLVVPGLPTIRPAGRPRQTTMPPISLAIRPRG